MSNVVTWEIKDGFNGNAFILITFSYKDSQDNPFLTEVQSWMINQNGDRLNVDLETTYHYLSNLRLSASTRN